MFISLSILSIIFSCGKDIITHDINIDLLKYTGKNRQLQGISNQLDGKTNIIDNQNIEQSSKVDWENYIVYHSLTDSLANMLVPILKNDQFVKNYLSIKIDQTGTVKSATIKTPRVVYSSGNDNEKLALQHDLYMLKTKGFKTDITLNKSQISSIKDANFLKAIKAKSINAGLKSNMKSTGSCTVVFNGYYSYPMGSPGETAYIYFMEELRRNLALSNIPHVIELGLADGIAIVGPLGSTSTFLGIVNEAINSTETHFGEDFTLVSLDITNSCTDDIEVPPLAIEDPCEALKKVLARASNLMVKSYSTQLQTKVSNSPYEWGVPLKFDNLTSSREFVSTLIFTNNQEHSLEMPMTWNNIDGFTVGGLHTHPSGSAPSMDDIFALLLNGANADLQSAGQTNIDFYRQNASQIIVTSDMNYVVTTKDWSKLESLYNDYLANPASFNQSIEDLITLHQTDLAGIIAKFGDAINIFLSLDNREELIPVTLNKLTNQVMEIPCAN